MKTIRNWAALALTSFALLWGPTALNTLTGSPHTPALYHLINGGGGGGGCC